MMTVLSNVDGFINRCSSDNGLSGGLNKHCQLCIHKLCVQDKMPEMPLTEPRLKKLSLGSVNVSALTEPRLSFLALRNLSLSPTIQIV